MCYRKKKGKNTQQYLPNMFSSGGKKEHNYLNFQLFIMYQHSFDSSQVRFENITINSFYKQTEPKQQFKFPFKKLQNSTYAESKYNTENSFTTNAGRKKSKKNPRIFPITEMRTINPSPSVPPVQNYSITTSAGGLCSVHSTGCVYIYLATVN